MKLLCKRKIAVLLTSLHHWRSFARILQRKKWGGFIVILSVWVFVDAVLIMFKVNITLVQVYIAIIDGNFRYFILVHIDLDYPIDFVPESFAVYNIASVIVVVEEYFLWVIVWVNGSKIDS